MAVQMIAARIRFPYLFRFGTVAMLCCNAWAHAAEPGAYDVTASVEMPHLEENLRYATTRQRRCLGADDFAALFPILQHPSLEGCGLAGDLLVCASPDVATGAVRLEHSPGRVSGVLEVKMGGKNMTFAQRVEAVRRGPCEPGMEPRALDDRRGAPQRR
jgi:hypothetical protein